MTQNADKKKITVPNILNYTIGLMMISLGMALMLAVKLGMSPTSSLPVTIYEVVNFFTAGRWITIVQIIFIIAAIVVSKRIRVSHILSFMTVIIMGLLIDMFEILVTPLIPSGLIVQIILILVSSIIMSIGASFLLLSEYPPVPDLYFMNELFIKYNIPVGKTKMIVDISSVILASILSYFVLHSFVHVGIGTVISALCLGFLISRIKPIIGRRFGNSSNKLNNKLLSILDYNLVGGITRS